jgi:CxxC motif-containing protein
MKRDIVCIACPIGCRLCAQWPDSGEVDFEAVTITGNRCRKGEEYGREEILSPRRVVTATVAVRGGHPERVPVKTTASLPKELITPLLEELYRYTVKPPLAVGSTILANFRGCGVDVVTTRTIDGSMTA